MPYKICHYVIFIRQLTIIGQLKKQPVNDMETVWTLNFFISTRGISPEKASIGNNSLHVYK